MSDKLIFFLGVNTGFVANGEPDRRFLDFYRERSLNRAGFAGGSNS
ncbi:hypothetical protein [Sphingomonas leidyi]